MTDNLDVNPAQTEVETTVTTSEPSTETKQNDAPDDAKSDFVPPTPEEKQLAQKRIDKITARYKEQERRAEQLEAELNQYRQQKPKNDEPKESDFETIEDYFVAKGKHEAKEEYAKIANQQKQEQLNKIQAEALNKKRAAFEESEAELRKTTPDYDDKVKVLNQFIDIAPKQSAEFQVFRDVLMNAPNMPELVYHLGSNPEIVEKMMEMSPVDVAWTLIREAVKLESAPKRKQTPIMATPPSPVSGSKSGDKSLENLSYKELQARWK